jgi:hypothetical protein
MPEELGKIERPTAESFKGIRKLYVVPLIFAGTDAPKEFRDKCELYWMQVNEQISNQEQKVGKINRIYHESISVGGEEGLKVMEKWNQLSYLVIKEKVDNCAVLEATELAELSDECMDWERCLLLGFFSHTAAETVANHYCDSSKRRFEYISKRIDESLKPGEVGILFIREGHSVQFPPDMDVFSVAPPALDEIHKWLRDRSQTPEAEEDEKPEQSPS